VDCNDDSLLLRTRHFAARMLSFKRMLPQEKRNGSGRRFAAVATAVAAPVGYLLLVAGVLLLIGGAIYCANGWVYAVVIALWTGALGLGACGLGALLVAPFRSGPCIIGAGLSTGSAALFFLFFASTTQADRPSLLLYGTFVFLVAIVCTIMAIFNRRRGH
jgi:hypothetical protein